MSAATAADRQLEPPQPPPPPPQDEPPPQEEWPPPHEWPPWWPWPPPPPLSPAHQDPEEEPPEPAERPDPDAYHPRRHLALLPRVSLPTTYQISTSTAPATTYPISPTVLRSSLVRDRGMPSAVARESRLEQLQRFRAGWRP
ncbi:hypothetical protein GCM10010278_08350 [Streptomyces melanogenes]|nr:hypothetical protein GCM10010278_08350 [Streptomyces melanogenes]